MEKIEDIAKRIRSEQVDEEEGSKALCLPCARALRDALNAAGYKAMVVQGTFAVDEPEYNDEFDPDDFEDEEDVRYHPLHYWVEVRKERKRLIVDITADQFNEEIDDDPIDPVVVDTYENLSRYKVMRRGWK